MRTPIVPCIIALLACLAVCEVSASVGFPPRPGQPPFPIWPTSFVADFNVTVPAYGPNFMYPGTLYYDYKIHSARAFYYDWCIPLFDGSIASSKLTNGKLGAYNHTCSFLMTAKGTYFISPDFSYEPDRCCYFGDIPPPTPDWLKNTQWNGTEILRGAKCNVWYFPGTDNPDDPYYAYWSRMDKQNTPQRFLGLSSIGVTILDYTSYKPGPIDPHMFDVPPNCNHDCVAPP